ncbi:MAG: thiamine phosphate synthase [Verrucomicrobiota bacterium]
MKPSLHEAKLYGILDLGYVDPRDVVPMTERVLEGGVDVLQLRAKGHSPDDILPLAKAIQPLCRRAACPFIVNDHLEVAERADADGLHLGQDDLSPSEARTILGEEKLIGLSTHSVSQALQAASEPVDYIGFGPLFSTPTKPEYVPIGTTEIATVHDHLPLPIFCIGGIKRENLPAVLDAGAKRVVIVSGILQAPDVSAYIKIAKRALG